MRSQNCLKLDDLWCCSAMVSGWPLCQSAVATDSSGYAHFGRAFNIGQQALLDLPEQYVILLPCPFAYSS